MAGKVSPSVARYQPDLAGLPSLLVKLATEVDWTSERDCFAGVARQLACVRACVHACWGLRVDLYSRGLNCSVGASEFYHHPAEGAEAAWTVEHVVYPALRGMLAPPPRFASDKAVVQIADLHDLYKVFERC